MNHRGRAHLRPDLGRQVTAEAHRPLYPWTTDGVAWFLGVLNSALGALCQPRGAFRSRVIKEWSSDESMWPGGIWDALGSREQAGEGLGGPQKDWGGSQPHAHAGSREEAAAAPNGVRSPTWPPNEVVVASF